MTSLITGGAGFIGSHLAERLLVGGEKVVIVDDLSTGSLDNISHIRGDIVFHQTNVTDEEIMKWVIQKVDNIYHLAAVVGVKNVMLDPLRTVLVNTRGTEIVLRLADRLRKKVLFTSSSEVYGKHGVGDELREDSDRVLGPVQKRRWCYASSKTIDEFMCLAYHQQRYLPVVVARLFNTVGPRQTGAYGMVIPRFVESALNNRPLLIHGDGEQVRSFCHVEDVADALVRLMYNAEAEGRIFNVGGTETVKIRELAEMVVTMTNSGSEIRNVPYEEVYGQGFEDMEFRRPDISRIGELIDFEPRHDLYGIIGDVIEWKRGEQGNG